MRVRSRCEVCRRARTQIETEAFLRGRRSYLVILPQSKRGGYLRHQRTVMLFQYFWAWNQPRLCIKVRGHFHIFRSKIHCECKINGIAEQVKSMHSRSGRVCKLILWAKFISRSVTSSCSMRHRKKYMVTDRRLRWRWRTREGLTFV